MNYYPKMDDPPEFIIGKYRLYKIGGGAGIWISCGDGGEGGEFDATKLEAVLDAFYKENF